jgi:hypothetical protein
MSMIVQRPASRRATVLTTLFSFGDVSSSQLRHSSTRAARVEKEERQRDNTAS